MCVFHRSVTAWLGLTSPASIFRCRTEMKAAQSVSWIAGFVSDRTKWIVSMMCSIRSVFHPQLVPSC
jgi:hypothetical protein